MILIFKGPDTIRVIPGVTEVMGFDFIYEEFIPGRPFGWFREGSKFGFGCMPEFFEKRFTQIVLIAGPGGFDKFVWIHGRQIPGENLYRSNKMTKKDNK